MSFWGDFGTRLKNKAKSLFGGSVGAPAPTAEDSDPDEFLAGKEQGFTSSNVATGSYDASQNYLEIGFKNGNRYGYHGVSPAEARSFGAASSPGKWVWDHLRVRGTVFGFQKPYALIAGKSQGTLPQYYAGDLDREQHRRIGPSGHGQEFSDLTTQKVPLAYHAGKHMADGGPVMGNPADGDNVPVRATAGEYVVPKFAAQQYRPLLDAISGHPPPGSGGGHYAAGGLVQDAMAAWINGRSPGGAAMGGALGSMIGMGPLGAALGGRFGPGGAGSAGRGPGTGGAGGGPMENAAGHLIEAARMLGDAAVKLGASKPAIGSPLSRSAWKPDKNQPGIFSEADRPAFTGVAPKVAGAGAEGAAGLGAMAGPVGIAVAGVVTGGMMLKGGFDQLKTSVIGLRDPVATLREYIGPFVSSIQKYNPGSVARMQLAFDNLTAAAGRWFEPIVPAVTGFANELNRAYGSIAGPVRGLVSDIAGMGVSIGREAFSSLFQIVNALVPAVRGFLAELGPMAPAARQALAALTDFAVGAVTWGGEAAAGVARFAAPLVEYGRPLIAAVVELWTALGPLVTGFFKLTSGITAIETLFGASGLQSTAKLWIDGVITMAAATIAGTKIMQQAWADLIRVINHPEDIGTFGSGISTFEHLFDQALGRMTAAQAPAAAALPAGGFTTAAQPARQIGIEAIGEQQRAAAFSAGRSNPAEATATNTANASATLTAIQQLLANMGASLPGLFGGPSPTPDGGGGVAW